MGWSTICSIQAATTIRKASSELSRRYRVILTVVDRSYQKQLELSQSHLDSLLSDTSSTLDLLASLTSSFKDVEDQTTTFQKQCAGLLEEQKRITGLADNLDHNLKYYNYLEPVTRRLNAPGAGNFVRSKEFSDMLARLDDCLEYMTAHVRFSHPINRVLLTAKA